MQGLPQEKLDEDLSARVLQIAERRMLLPDDSGGKPSAGRAAEALKESETDPIGWLGQIQQGKPAWREISWRGMFSKRALIWSGVVVATAIIISFNSPPPKANRDLARRQWGTRRRHGSRFHRKTEHELEVGRKLGRPRRPTADIANRCNAGQGRRPLGG